MSETTKRHYGRINGYRPRNDKAAKEMRLTLAQVDNKLAELNGKLKVIEEWLFANLKHPDWMNKASERSLLTTDYKTWLLKRTNLSLHRPPNGYADTNYTQLKQQQQ